MKITIRELKQLIKEAVFNTPPKIDTSGKGYWTKTKKSVTITTLALEADRDEDPPQYGELRVFFKNWDVDKDGLIYTDPQFERKFVEILRTIGFSMKTAKSVSYSEQGMQGDDYVSMDVGADFIREWDDLVGQDYIRL